MLSDPKKPDWPDARFDGDGFDPGFVPPTERALATYAKVPRGHVPPLRVVSDEEGGLELEWMFGGKGVLFGIDHTGAASIRVTKVPDGA